MTIQPRNTHVIGSARCRSRPMAAWTPAGTTRGFGPAEFKQVGALITEVLDGLAANGEEGNGKVEASVRKRVKALTDRFPIY